MSLKTVLLLHMHSQYSRFSLKISFLLLLGFNVLFYKHSEFSPIFSVVIPVFNTGTYLNQAVDSLINQSLNFRKYVQIVLVNDGSSDNSSEYCLQYKHLYPTNIVYLEQAHKGVSSARNLGLKYVKGKYTTFMDSDDVWSCTSFSEVYNFFLLHPEISIVTTRIKFFEMKTRYHYLDYRFSETRVVRILEDYSNIVMHVPASFFKTSIIEKRTFLETMRYSEDSLFINLVVLDYPNVGFIKEAVYLYRRRKECNSATNHKIYDKDYYLATPSLFYQALIDRSIEKFGEVIKYVQYLIMYDIHWRYKNVDRISILSMEESTLYKNTLDYYLCHVARSIVQEQKTISPDRIAYYLSRKDTLTWQTCLGIQSEETISDLTESPTIVFDWCMNETQTLKLVYLNLCKHDSECEYIFVADRYKFRIAVDPSRGSLRTIQISPTFQDFKVFLFYRRRCLECTVYFNSYSACARGNEILASGKRCLPPNIFFRRCSTKNV